MRYALLKNPEHLTRNQQAAMEMITKSDKKPYRAYLLKEGLRTVFKCDAQGAAEELKRWLAWAQRCRIPDFVNLGRKIKRHNEAILSTITHELSNARIEAVNNKIKVTIRMGYGFRNIDNLIALVKLKSGDYNIVLPGR
jgi:transposase